MLIIPWYVILVRLLVPFLILIWPLAGIFLSMVADMSDWKFIHVASVADGVRYQAWDKVMDLYYWFFILWIVRFWKDIWSRRVAISFFVYRLIGVIWFWLTGWRPILFFFPNFFEHFVILCLLLFWLKKKQKLHLTLIQKSAMLTVVIVPKLVHEYFQHFLGKQPWEIYDVGKGLGLAGFSQEYMNLLVWEGTLYIIPMLVFLWWVWKSQSKR